MALFDALELLDIVDLVLSWRFFVCAGAGVGMGLAVYVLGNQSDAAGVIGVVIGGIGVVTGLIWQWRHERS